jgi:putative phosphoribosyl transferase
MRLRRRVIFENRDDAGRRLARRVREAVALDVVADDAVVLGLPRGGVPVAAAVAEELGAPLDVIVVRKLGVPFQTELAMGAIGECGVRVINNDVVLHSGVGRSEIDAVERRERSELERRAARFRSGRERVSLVGTTAVIVDDGIATGSTAKAACRVARALGAHRVVLAVPVAPVDWIARIAEDADVCVALETPDPFVAVGEFYDNFDQTSDSEVIECLKAAAARRAAATLPLKDP